MAPKLPGNLGSGPGIRHHGRAPGGRTPLPLALEYPPRVCVTFSVKQLLPLLLAGILFAGCASNNTVQKRRTERATAYAALPLETRELVDKGQIKVGMTMDAVYIAWGKPAQVLQSEDEHGAVTTWLYEGGWLEETRYWSYRSMGRGRDMCLERYPMNDYQPRTYIRAQLTFVDGVLKSWRTLPQPTY